MITIKIRHRRTNDVLHTAQVDDADPSPIRTALSQADLDGANLDGADLHGANLDGADLHGANLDGANLRGAYLDGADLRGANLHGANLRGAYLDGANLHGANLRGAYLDGAYLHGADLHGANLDGADLHGANLDGADLHGANLDGANLDGAYLDGADLRGANLHGANLRGAYLDGAYLRGARNLPAGFEAKNPPEPYVRPATPEAVRLARQRRTIAFRERHPEVPVVENLDRKILDVLDSGKGSLEMATWHTCETTHCRAGWAITLAGVAGRELERKLGAAVAGAQIYRASTGRVPYFYGDNDSALADIRRSAEEQETLP